MTRRMRTHNIPPAKTETVLLTTQMRESNNLTVLVQSASESNNAILEIGLRYTPEDVLT